VQPKDHALIYLIPGIDNFPREDLIKGIHYFDSVTDLLSKVTSDPNLISVPNNCTNDDKCNCETSSNSLHPTLQNSEVNLMEFTVIDTSLVEQEGVPCKIRTLRSLPLDTFTTTYGLLCKPEDDKSAAPERLDAADSPNESTDVGKDKPVELNLAENNALEDAKLKSKKRVYVHDAAKLSKRRRTGSSKFTTETYENDQSNPHCADDLSFKSHVLEPESEKKKISQASQPSVNLNLPDLTSTSDENNEKEGVTNNSWRRGTINRPPTTKALESLAMGFLETAKRKDSESKSCSSRLTRRACRAVETVIIGAHENVPMTASVSPCACSDDLMDHV
jgi:hypothetical protein